MESKPHDSDPNQPDSAVFASGRRTPTKPDRITHPSGHSRDLSVSTVKRASPESCSGLRIRTPRILSIINVTHTGIILSRITSKRHLIHYFERRDMLFFSYPAVRGVPQRKWIDGDVNRWFKLAHMFPLFQVLFLTKFRGLSLVKFLIKQSEVQLIWSSLINKSNSS